MTLRVQIISRRGALKQANQPKSHPFTILTVVEIAETSTKLQPWDNRAYTYRNATGSITCNGWDNANEPEYDGTFTSYCGSKEEPEDENCYVVKGRMIPSNDTAEYQVYYDAEHMIHVGTSEAFTGTLHNNTGVSGFGIVGAKTEVPEATSDSAVLVFVMKHVDYRPETKETPEFEVEYRMRPTPNPKGTQRLIQEGKETLVHGYIVDWNGSSNRWVVDVTGVNVGSGHQTAPKKKISTGSQVTASGRVRPAKHTASSSPAPAPKRKAPTKGKGKAAARDPPDEVLDEDVLDDFTPPTPTNPKKRARAPAKTKLQPPIPVEPEDPVGEDPYDEDLFEEEASPEQSTSKMQMTRAGRQPKRSRGA
ncbi:uncharacterized protein MELLADRAFT_110986 [Melampsora larici-populina 98AG31]|uniref:Uncharacterized protein n=1 Tax=Melampsora larici-populina (strain 98AG31 / pathotype 3-4-7) TaxID=747676 RepID=F4S1N4_MELLP|nr:uncharacterized protein MELLADRAFT_110986 [Melampsora larici-populina 98AG31]EGG01409.1 hypothetical protein MELLADRAFT_110986 [Melampsora larici-populina 98AG31]